MQNNFGKLGTKLGALGLAGVVLAGCGTDPGDRGLSGGLIGAGTGAAIGAIAGNAATGALVGGLGGAAIGLLTSSNVIDLGKPVWRQHASSRSHHRHYAKNDCSTRETQTQRITTCSKGKG
jgi:osmotically inducible lipoprotein OsmB